MDVMGIPLHGAALRVCVFGKRNEICMTYRSQETSEDSKELFIKFSNLLNRFVTRVWYISKPQTKLNFYAYTLMHSLRISVVFVCRCLSILYRSVVLVVKSNHMAQFTNHCRWANTLVIHFDKLPSTDPTHPCVAVRSNASTFAIVWCDFNVVCLVTT